MHGKRKEELCSTVIRERANITLFTFSSVGAFPLDDPNVSVTQGIEYKEALSCFVHNRIDRKRMTTPFPATGELCETWIDLGHFIPCTRKVRHLVSLKSRLKTYVYQQLYCSSSFETGEATGCQSGQLKKGNRPWHGE